MAKFIGAQEDADEKIAKGLAELVSAGSGLQRGPISKFLEIISTLSTQTGLAEFDVYGVPVLYLLSDIALLQYTRNELESFRSTALLLSYLIQTKMPQVKLFRSVIINTS